MNATLHSRREQILQQIDNLDSIPSVEAIVVPLISYLQQPLENVDTQRVIDLISHDNSLAAQCLHMANSPLFGRWQAITTTRGAVIALGLQRMREVALSCCVLKLMPGAGDNANPLVFWEHSLACAFICRRIAKRIGMKDPEQAYLAGLLHDVGFIIALRLLQEDFYSAMREAASRNCSMDLVEEERFAIDHCEMGKLLARKWRLNPEIIEVVSYHHRSSMLAVNRALIALVSLSDRLCRIHGLGYGYPENITINWESDDAISTIRDSWPIARSVNWPRFSSELDSYLGDVRKLVSVLYRFNN